MTVYCLYILPFYDSITKEYRHIVTINKEPEGALKPYVKRVMFPKLSSFEGFGGNGKYHYVLFFDNWAEMGKFFQKASISEELAEFNSSLEPGRATLVSSHSGSTLSN